MQSFRVINFNNESAGNFRLKLFAVFVCVLLLTGLNSYGTVIVTAPTNGTCIDITPGSFTTLNDIVITEGSRGDLPTQVLSTLILTVPAGFEFNPGVGTITGTIPGPNGNLVPASLAIAVTSTTITVTFSANGTNKWDVLTIGGIQVRALIPGVSGHILRLAGAAGGTGTVTGDAPGAGISHGYLEAEFAHSVYTIASGNWTNAAIWSGGFVPICSDTIYVRHDVTLDAAASARHVVVETNGILRSTFALTIDSSFHITGTGTYIHNNLTNATTTIFKGTENFVTTSNITILRWHNTAVAFPNGVSGNFGNITFDQGAVWGQQGQFAPAKIKGTLTVSSGTVTMDEGAGLTTALTLSDVVVNGTGALIMASGPARNLVLNTGNYTDSSTSATRSSMLLNCQGNLSWTANGNVSISHSWSGYQHSGTNVGNTSITINGNLNISGGSFDINKDVNAPLNLVVTGNTTISGTPTHVRFIDRNSGALTFSTNNFYINGGTTTQLMGGSNPTGSAQVTVSNDFLLTGSGTIAQLYNNLSSVSSLTLTTGRDLIVTTGELRLANTNGSITVNAGRNVIVNSATGMLRGQIFAGCNASTSVNVTGYLEVNSGTMRISEGLGSLSLIIVENLNLNNGVFHGIYNLLASNNGAAVLNCDNINFTGGTFSFFTANINDGKTVQVNCNTDVTVNFTSGTDVFTFVALAGVNNALLDLNIGYHVNISGNFPGSYFISSASSGTETVDIGGNFTVNAGDVYFVGNEGGLTNSHTITTNISGNVTINGGNTRLATGGGTATINIAGDVSLTAGILTLKYSSGAATMTVSGDYSQSNGTFNIHSRNLATPNSSTVIFNGNFSLTNGTFNFDNFSAAAGLAEHSVYINGPAYTLGGTALITHANNLTANYIFGQIYFNRTGTTTYTRSSSTNEIRHIKYTINSLTTVDASASPNGFQMTSVASATAAIHNALTIDGTLDMGNQVLSARQNVNYYSRLIVNSGGRYRTSHTGGLYSGSSSIASSIDGYMLTLNRVNFFLHAASVVEYYGTATSVVTGIPNGIANSDDHQYGILEINFTGSAGTTWVYPETTDEVFIRTSLILTEGEFNLDSDHITSTGGRAINLENGATMSRTNGFIRSETEDGSGLVRWDITANGSYTIAFGYDASTYIPFTYQQTTGSSGIVSVGTYRSAADNTPYPPTVTHTRDVAGNENSGFTVDRFWYINVPGNATSDITFTYAPTEGVGIISPRAQLWEPVTMGWFPPILLQSNPTGITTFTQGITGFNNWWTLSAGSSPLPIELLSFNAKKAGNTAELQWLTASETNNDYFTIERSSTGNNFESIGNVNGAGTSSSVNDYNFTDYSPEKGINYYRLKQTDFDGRSSYSDIQSITFYSKNKFDVYPNLLTISDEIQVFVSSPGDYEISLVDNTGKLVMNRILNVKDQSSFSINLSEIQISSGLYFLNIKSNEDVHSQKIAIR